ncbi:hypothetical protein JCM2811A_05140 [Methylorubrum rhodinum]
MDFTAASWAATLGTVSEPAASRRPARAAPATLISSSVVALPDGAFMLPGGAWARAGETVVRQASRGRAARGAPRREEVMVGLSVV